MNGAWISLIVSLSSVAILLVLHALLEMCEISLVKFRYGRVDDKEWEGLKRHRGIAYLMENGDQTGRVVRFSKTLCTVAVGLLLMAVVSDFFGLFESGKMPDRWLVVLMSFLGAVSVHFFFAEIFPRGLAMKDPVKGILCSYRVLLVFQIITMPAMLFFRGLKRMLFRRLGVDVQDELNPLDLDVQIRALGEDSHDLSPVVRKIVNRALQMRELVVQDVLLPRSQVVICDLEETFEANLKIMKQAGHTRFPLCRGNLDDCIGILHIKDIFRCGEALADLDPVKLKRNVAMFELETPLEEALERMLRAKFHMALAVDEFGGIVGVVTFESILEELVGEIQDEFDTEEDEIRELRAPNTYRILGLTPIHDVEQALALEIGNDEVSTFGGLITGELGRIPARGDTLTLEGMRITIDEVDERRVIATRVVREGTLDQ
jgi:CBS domain containing-hemolysin-like protein